MDICEKISGIFYNTKERVERNAQRKNTVGMFFLLSLRDFTDNKKEKENSFDYTLISFLYTHF